MQARKGACRVPTEYEASPDVIAWAYYNHFLRTNCLMDFDDVLLHARDLLRDNTEVRQRVQKQYSHMLVDEVQDCNQIQVQP